MHTCTAAQSGTARPRSSCSSAPPRRRTSKPSPRKSFRPMTRLARAKRASCSSSIGRSRRFFPARWRLSRAARRFPGGVPRTVSRRRSFASLTSEQQIEYLKGVDQTPFFNTTRLLTLLGMFSLPAYGGNRDGVGWKLLGFEDGHVFHPPFGYYDRDYPGIVIDPEATSEDADVSETPTPSISSSSVPAPPAASWRGNSRRPASPSWCWSRARGSRCAASGTTS